MLLLELALHSLAGPVIKLLSIDNVLSQVLTAITCTSLLLYMDMYLSTLYCIEKKNTILTVTVNLAIIIHVCMQ